MENQAEEVTFDMDALRVNLPQKEGVVEYYSGNQGHLHAWLMFNVLKI
ncbi:hypothetical protein OIU74_003972 [Salix koriyanagi]|uniref:Uncharacterized protein n=1 Tax=Salix koriyanagi TaxID=2511006 RepID=A0A9Q0UZ72_9ROSI|nr:hypothetical protein OIU74_003972 [Salix koriyanagi]